MYFKSATIFAFFLLLVGCRYFQPTEPALFKRLPARETGITFNNALPENDSLNALKFDYLYNGSGVAVGDINNDGLEDIYFAGNMVSGKLYLNKGNFKFEDITQPAGVTTNRWGTGVAMVDINQDGFLDIYVCNAGPVAGDKWANQLFINNKNNTFTEAAAAYGLADTGYSTHAAFFDYDKDGDLDMYLLTNAREDFNRNLVRPKSNQGMARSTDRLYRNNGNNTFTNVSQEAGITMEGYGLGVGISDINQDGWPDIYVANDFITNDLLWINNGDGTFTNKINQYLQHQSYNGMGTDIADINNDGHPEIMVLDMLPEDNQHQKTMLLPGNYDRFRMNLQLGYEPQYVRNSLQLNNGNGTFSEIGQLAGVSNTDWSWGPLFADYDNDGYRDLLITNGYRKDVTDLDFVLYSREVSMFGTDEIRQQEAYKKLKNLKGTKLHNYLYRNNRDLTFTNKSEAWGLGEPSYSHGGAYADLDNDGDLDLVINNLDAEAFIYQNLADKQPDKHFLKIKFNGTALNPGGIGAKVELQYRDQRQVYEHFVHKGYKSTVSHTAHFGLGAESAVTRLTVTWADGQQQVLRNLKADRTLTLSYQDATEAKAATPAPVATLFNEVTADYGIDYQHQETDYVDFKIQPLLPRKLSQEGPGMAVGDVNGDGFEDFFVGGSANHAGMLFLQQPNGRFISQPLTTGPKQEEDMGVLFFDADNDQDLDLYIVSGGSEYGPTSRFYQDRLYKNDGRGNFSLDVQALPKITASGSCVTAADYDQDGDLDLFVGGRVIPGRYPLPAQSYLLRNESGRFTDVTNAVAKELGQIGLVTAALWTDFDQDKQLDLILVGEWMPLTFFRNDKGKFTDVTAATGLGATSGWWNSITACDYDNDGDMDYVAGNLGLNSKYKASEEEPVCIYAKDYDQNGSLDPVLCYFIQGKNYPTHPRDALTDQIVGMRKRFPSYEKYGEATLNEVFTKEELAGAYIARSDYYKSSCIENLGKGQFKLKALPIQAQLAPVYGLLAKDYDGDNLPDLLLIGNSHATEVATGWYDALIGLYLKGDGKGNFTPVSATRSGFMVKEDGKALAEITAATGESLILAATNQGPLRLFSTGNTNQNIPVKLAPDDAYGMVTDKNGKTQRCEFYYGGGYLAQSSRTWQLPVGATSVTLYNFKGKARNIAI